MGPTASMAPSNQDGGLLALLDRRSILICLGLCVTSGIIEFQIWRAFDAHHLFDQFNVLFHSDPPTRLQALANGWGNRMFEHPHFSNFFTPFVRLLVRLGGALGLIDGSGAAAREQIAMLLTPVASGLKTGVLFYVFRLLGLRLTAAALAAIFGMVSFSHIVFGTIPETYGIEGALMAPLYLYALVVIKKPSADRTWIWGLLGFVIAGITISNIAFVGLVLWFARAAQGMPVWRAFWHSVGVNLAVLVLVIATSVAVKYTIERPGDPGGKEYFAGFSQFLRPDTSTLWNAPWYFPRMLWLTFIPRAPATVANESAFQRHSPIKIRFSYDNASLTPGELARSLLTLSLFAAAGFMCWRRGPEWRMVGLSASGILVSNWALHAVWGEDWYLYSQHWQVPALMMLSVFLTIPGRWRTVTLGAFSVAAVASAIGGYVVLTGMFSVLEALPGAAP